MLLRKKPETLTVFQNSVQSLPKYTQCFRCSWHHSWYWNWTAVFDLNYKFSECWGKRLQSQYSWTGIIP